MANLTYSSTLQDRIARRVWNAAYSTLTSNQKGDVDGAWASGSLSTGRAYEAFRLVTQLGQWTELTDSTSVSDAADVWFVDETAFRLALTHRPERIAEFKGVRNESRQFYFNTVTTTIVTTGYGSDVFTLTPQSIRYYVLRRFVSLNQATNRLPSPEEIDGVTFDTLNWFWYSRQWNFRRRSVSITIPTASDGASPTINTVAGETFDQLVTRNLYYSTTDGISDMVVWADADKMATLKADSTSTDSKPRYFRLEKSGSSAPTWIWHPYPDQEYTVRAEIVIALPGTTTPGVWDSATDSVPFAKIPVEFRALFKELVCGAVMKNRGMDDQVYKDALDKFERAATTYDDHGEADVDGQVRDVYRDRESQAYGLSLYGWRGGL